MLLIAAILGCSIEIAGLASPRIVAAMLFFVVTVGLAFAAIRRFAAERHAEQTHILKQLLEFTQSIHGTAQPEQIHAALASSLQRALGLAGLITLGTSTSEAAPITVLAEYPKHLCDPEAIMEMESAACPCLRQNLPREFKSACTPIRCAVDRAIQMGSEHAAFCIPLTIANRANCLVHMLLPPNVEWTEQRKQLAQAYVNAACSALMSLHLLHDAQLRSMTDPLTQLYNRLSLEQLLQREIALAERHDLPFSLVMIDLDEFKQINDTFGHAAGDDLLKALSDCIRMTLRKTDLAFRLGGDEFVLALPQTSIDQARQAVEKLRQAFASIDYASVVARLDRPPTLSIGLAERDRAYHLITLPGLLAAADQALYEAKRDNRNCVRVYAGAA